MSVRPRIRPTLEWIEAPDDSVILLRPTGQDIRVCQTQVEEVERDEADWIVNPPPGDRLADLRRGYLGSRLVITPLISDFYFWMNTTKPPFDDVLVRRAVNYAINPAALDRIYGGTMTPLQQVLPATMPGHRPIDPYPYDPAKARELVAAADPRERHVTVWTENYPTTLEAGEYYEGALRKIGLEPTLKILSSTNYFTVIGNPSTPNLDTGWGSWLLEYPHPASFFVPQLTREGIRAVNTTNWARFTDPHLEAEMSRLGREPLGAPQEAGYAHLDRQVMRAAPWAPFGSMKQATFVSRRIDLAKLVINPVFGQDLTSFAPRRQED